MKLKILTITVSYSILCIPAFADIYESSGYEDNYVDDIVFEQIIDAGVPSDPYQSGYSDDGQSYDLLQEPYDRDSIGYNAELPSALEQALYVDGVIIDEFNSVLDAQGNYLGQADEMYGLNMSTEQVDDYSDEGYAFEDERYIGDEYQEDMYVQDSDAESYADEEYYDEQFGDDVLTEESSIALMYNADVTPDYGNATELYSEELFIESSSSNEPYDNERTAEVIYTREKSIDERFAELENLLSGLNENSFQDNSSETYANSGKQSDSIIY